MNFSAKFLLLLLIIISFGVKANNNGFAVILVDMQEGFYKRGGVTGTQGLNDLVQKDKELLEWATNNDIPVLVLEYEDYGQTDPKLMSVLEGYTYSVIEKNRDGGFYGKSKNAVIKQLNDWKVDSIIIAGINGAYCVKSTAIGAIQNGFDVMTSSDIVGNINQNPPLYPNATWFFGNNKFVVFESLDQIIK